ncbi:hypothetical protein N7523_005616 [Penicillium sp. IBT 18751x]|nr:hypothetical protein N7523_005616 [Penicillium sp. IBT 18751x]
MYARVLGSWKETSNEEIDLSEFDEHTISCALSYFYARDYHPFLKLGHDDEKETCEVSETKSVPNDCQRGGESKSAFSEGLRRPTIDPNRGLGRAKLENAVLPGTTSKAYGSAENDPQHLAFEALTHAKVYSFAHIYLLSDFENFALSRLTEVLAVLQHKQLSMLPELAEAIRLIYHKTPKQSDNSARNLLSQFVALKFTALLGDQLEMLMADGGEFAVDVTRKLARKLLADPLEEKIDELSLKVSALESECLGMEKDLNTAREEVNGWERWNDNLPSRRRR